MAIYAVDRLIPEARRLAAEYRRATGKPLGGISAEIALYDATRLLDLEPATAGGYDAVGRGRRAGRRIQIKGRSVVQEGRASPRLGQLKIDQEWDSVMLVLMDEEYEPTEIYEAERAAVLAALGDPERSKRARRGAMSVARFKNIGRLVWTRETGAVDDEVWDSRREP